MPASSIASLRYHNPRPAGQGSRSWATVALFSAGFVFLALAVFQYLNYYDEGVVLVAAERIGRGEVPYRDFFAIYAPGQFYTLAAVFRVFGASILVERIWDTLVRFGICIVAYLITRELVSKRSAYCSFLIALLLLASSGFYGSPLIPALFWSLLAVLLLLHYSAGRGRVFLFLAGLASGIAFVYRHDWGCYIALSAAAAILVLGFQHSSLAGKGARKAVRCLGDLLLYGAGDCVIVIPVLVYFLRAVPAGDLRVDFLDFPRVMPHLRVLPFPSFLPTLSSGRLLFLWFAFYPPMVVLLISWIGLLKRVWSSFPAGEDTGRRFGQTLLTLFGSELVIPACARPDRIHCLGIMLVASILLLVLLADWHGREGPAWRLAVVKGCVLVLAAGYVFAPLLKWKRSLAAYPPWGQTSSLSRAHGFYVDSYEDETIRYVLQSVPADQAIFVGNAQHHRVCANDILFYFLSGHRPGSRYHDFIPGLITTARVQQEVIDDLERNHVDYVVLSSGPGFESSADPQETVADSGVTLLDDFLHREFLQVQAFGRYSIWKRVEDQGRSVLHSTVKPEGPLDLAPAQPLRKRDS